MRCIHYKISAILQMKHATGYFVRNNEEMKTCHLHLKHHIQRANYQALVWKQSLKAVQNLPSPNGHGWSSIGGSLVPVLMSKEAAPSGLLELTSCKCKKSACRRMDLCQCKANNLLCTEACYCMAGELCENINTILMMTEVNTVEGIG